MYRWYDIYIVQVNPQTIKTIKIVQNFYGIQYQCTVSNCLTMKYPEKKGFLRNFQEIYIISLKVERSK